MSYTGLATQLKAGEVCIFIDEQPAEQITELQTAPGQFAISKICTINLREAKAEDNTLTLYYHDGVIGELYL